MWKRLSESEPREPEHQRQPVPHQRVQVFREPEWLDHPDGVWGVHY